MRIAVTGTPGTGKTTATARLAFADEREEPEIPPLEVIHLNEVLEREGFYTDVDPERESKIADLEALDAWLAGRTDVLFESHLAHHLEADRVVVLRCAPAVLERRLLERGASSAKARENAESEALDVVLAEAVDRHGHDRVYEVDTTEMDPSAVAREIAAVCRGDRAPSAGTVDFVGYLS